MSRVRQEAKILKNYYLELSWQIIAGVEFNLPVSRYKPNRVWLAHQRLVKACRARYRNDARKEWNENGNSNMYRYYNHKACSEVELREDALRWWNIPD